VRTGLEIVYIGFDGSLTNCAISKEPAPNWLKKLNAPSRWTPPTTAAFRPVSHEGCPVTKPKTRSKFCKLPLSHQTGFPHLLTFLLEECEKRTWALCSSIFHPMHLVMVSGRSFLFSLSSLRIIYDTGRDSWWVVVNTQGSFGTCFYCFEISGFVMVGLLIMIQQIARSDLLTLKVFKCPRRSTFSRLECVTI
jgi:hypothetical protein